MPTLKKIVIRDFRNIELQELEFSPNVNCITGGNGAGKTNLLDAIYYLSMTKSAFASTDRYNYRHGCREFAISGTYDMPEGGIERFSIQVEDGAEKKVRKGDRPCAKISEHIGRIPIVMVSPADSTLVSESGEERRRFVNSVLSQMDRNYLTAVQQYNRLLAQRNSYLKDSACDEEMLQVFDARMSASATTIYEARKAFAVQLSDAVAEYCRAISGGNEEVSVEYRSDLADATLEEVMMRHRERDRVLRYTGAGIHRDDFIFSMNGHPIRKCGSQGQQKSFLVALKFAQYDIMKRSYGFPPILLLDDLFDKLDMERISNLLRMVAGSDFGQIFISDANKVRTEGLVAGITSESTYFEAEGGSFARRDG